MRHNQNARRPRGRGPSGGGHHNSGGGNYRSSGVPEGRRVNPRVQTFDSNGPEVRIRGTAYQINEKYVTLARDAASAGDRILAESYLQHAEHYQRFINEMTEEYNIQNPQQQLQPQSQPQPMMDGNAALAAAPQVEELNDLDQGFLVGPRRGNGLDPAQQEQPQLGSVQEQQPSADQQVKPRSGRHYTPRRNNETESV